MQIFRIFRSRKSSFFITICPAIVAIFLFLKKKQKRISTTIGAK
ncbi:hypothetical protein RCH33_598 [Flavobacterium daejeonense]|nr:hypothetical protein RCH33_598 [Flavobacterium daejeonense]